MPNSAVPQGIITPLVTPYRAGAVDHDALRALVARQMLAGVSGLLVCDPTGEGFALSHGERDGILVGVIAAVRGHIPVITATGTNCTATTIELTSRAAELGASAAMVTVPYYSKPGERGILHHFETVAQATSLPIIVDNDPGRTASRLSGNALARLSEIPTIAGIRHCDGDVAALAAMAPALRTRFVHYAGDDPTALALLLEGATGMISPLANLVPRLVGSLQRAAVGMNMPAAEAIHERLMPLMKALGPIDPPSLKAALSLMIHCPPDVRLPLVPPEADDMRGIADALRPHIADEEAFNATCRSGIWS